ncbi:MAG: c-type cytochrome, partial [Pseudonocardiaceae bacterium]
MTMLSRYGMLALAVALGAYTGQASAADANAGKTFFRGQCALCHSAEPGDNGGAQGPNLHGVFGREAASDSQFGYTAALKKAHLTWDGATLGRFLTAPTTVVPGSAMVIPVPKAEDRENLIAYFQAVKEGTFKAEAPSGPPGGFRLPPNTGAPPKGDADWKRDAPGRLHRIDVAKLPPPFDTGSVANFPRFVDKPAGAKLSLPPGFKVEVFATGLQGPRTMRLAPNGDIFLVESQTGKIKVMRPSADGSTAASIETFAQGLLQPFGIQFYPSG